MFLLEGMDSLEAHMQLSWTVKLGKVCQNELWLSHRGRDGFLHVKDKQDSEVGLVTAVSKCFGTSIVMRLEVVLITYERDLLGHLDLGNNSSSYVICKTSCLTDAECVGT